MLWQIIEQFRQAKWAKASLLALCHGEKLSAQPTLKEDFLKVVDFVHYLRAEGYDMVTFDKVASLIDYFDAF